MTTRSPVLDLERLERDLDELHATVPGRVPLSRTSCSTTSCEPGRGRGGHQGVPAARPRPVEQLPARQRAQVLQHRSRPPGGRPCRPILEELNSPRFVEFVGKLIGVEHLIADPSLEGGGLHQSTTGGFLNIHADFTVHPHNRKWQRRANLLLYLNEDWKPEYGGDLELWSADMKQCVKKVSPIANRVLIFTTDPTSFHGHPEPMRCPEGVARRSTGPLLLQRRGRPGGPVDRVPGPTGRRAPLDPDLRRQADAAGLRLGQTSPRLSDQMASRLLGFRDRVRRKGPAG